MAYTIFGRGETSFNFNKRDTYFLYHMLNMHNEEVLQPDVGYHMARHIEGVLNNLHIGGAISIGGVGHVLGLQS
jgi:hypothetical protein